MLISNLPDNVTVSIIDKIFMFDNFTKLINYFIPFVMVSIYHLDLNRYI